MELRFDLRRIVRQLIIPAILAAGCSGQGQASGGAAGANLVQPALKVSIATGYTFQRANVVVVLPLSAGDGSTPPNQIELQGLTKQLIESLEVYSRFRVLNVEEQDKITKLIQASGADLADGGLTAAAAVGRKVDADLVISGVVSDFGGSKAGKHGGEVKDYQSEGNLNFRLWLTDAKSGQTAATVSYQKRRDSVTDNLFNAREALSAGLVSKDSTEVSKDAFVQIAKKVDALK